MLLLVVGKNKVFAPDSQTALLITFGEQESKIHEATNKNLDLFIFRILFSIKAHAKVYFS